MKHSLLLLSLLMIGFCCVAPDAHAQRKGKAKVSKVKKDTLDFTKRIEASRRISDSLGALAEQRRVADSIQAIPEKVTLFNFKYIEDGSDFAYVQAFLGTPSKRTETGTGAYRTVTYEYVTNDRRGHAAIVFQGGKVVSKSQTGLR